mmetsp:Transcript_24155/g.50224  ORF Transcript_24155/g.50224 Transcript_24155/m.50224 type:complete len:93 (-) Transcript_24155:1567-1845(-)
METNLHTLLMADYVLCVIYFHSQAQSLPYSLSSVGADFLLFPRERSFDRRTPAWRGPVSVEGAAADFSTMVPEDWSEDTTATGSTGFSGAGI